MVSWRGPVLIRSVPCWRGRAWRGNVGRLVGKCEGKPDRMGFHGLGVHDVIEAVGI